ncbi:barstar family protein [Actinoplanes subglobosus]|uniref:Barstar family protein n=1 Tax=Actinoplanes subglobosus TaxID=1547892 RepID=A0ABV8IIP6_9ACTN
MAKELVVDLRGNGIETLDDFWDAVSGPCGLPPWFGRNIDAWRDTIQARGISDVIDRHDVLVIHVDRAGLFSRKNYEARALREAFAGRRSRLVVHQPLPLNGSDPHDEATD